MTIWPLYAKKKKNNIKEKLSLIVVEVSCSKLLGCYNILDVMKYG